MSSLSGAGRLAALALVVIAPAAARAHDYKAGDIVIQNPWARATPNGAQVAGGYLTIVNHGSTPETLTGGSLEASGKFELHDMSSENGVMKMRPTGPLMIAPGSSLTLSPAGKHIMFAQLKHGLKKGEEVQGTLTFDHAGTVPVTFEVEGIGAKGGSSHMDHAMPGMDMD